MPVLNFRVTAEKKARIEAVAKTPTRTVSDYLRDVIDAALKRDERKSKEK